MGKNRYNADEISRLLREADVLLGRGQTISQACKQIGIIDQVYHRWHKAYGGMRVDQVRRLKELEAENARLEDVVTVLTVDKLILKDIAEDNR